MITTLRRFRCLSFFFFLFACKVSSAQRSAILEAFQKYYVDTSVLNPNLGANSMQYSYALKRVVTTDQSEKTYLSSYDPGKNGLDRWKLISVNGKQPSGTDLKNFNKEHQIITDYKIDETTLKIVKEDVKNLQVSYQYEPSSIDADHTFLKDCLFTLVINTTTGRLESVLQKNLREFKIKMVKAGKLEGQSDFIYNEGDKKYLLKNADLVIVMKLLGQQVSLVTTDTYTYTYNE